MKIIINNSSMTPIYEQIVDQIKAMIINGELVANTVLPSVRSLSKELKISALTVKKAYVNASNKNLIIEEQRKEVEQEIEMAIQKGRRCGLSDEEIRALFELMMEEWVC